jgi:hypothetical protein
MRAGFDESMDVRRRHGGDSDAAEAYQLERFRIACA